MRAVWNGAVIAESEETIQVEGNPYFPPDSVDTGLLRESSSTSVCGWKGQAGYYDVVVDEEVNRDAAWVYRPPSQAARSIAGYVAFWRGVRVEPSSSSVVG